MPDSDMWPQRALLLNLNCVKSVCTWKVGRTCKVHIFGWARERSGKSLQRAPSLSRPAVVPIGKSDSWVQVKLTAHMIWIGIGSLHLNEQSAATSVKAQARDMAENDSRQSDFYNVRAPHMMPCMESRDMPSGSRNISLGISRIPF